MYEIYLSFHFPKCLESSDLRPISKKSWSSRKELEFSETLSVVNQNLTKERTTESSAKFLHINELAKMELNILKHR